MKQPVNIVKDVQDRLNLIDPLDIASQVKLVQALKVEFIENFSPQTGFHPFEFSEGIHLLLDVLNKVDEDLIERCYEYTVED